MQMTQPWSHLTIKFSSPPVDRTAIEAASKRVKLPLPPEYIEFLLVHNGGTVKPWKRFPIEGCETDTHGLLNAFYNVGDPEGNELVQKYKVFRRRVPPGVLPIACDLGSNQICLVCTGERTGQVVFWDRAHEANTDEGEAAGWGNVHRIADSFGDFLRGLDEAE